MKKHVTVVISLLAFSIAILCFLSLTMVKPNSSKNGFYRSFVKSSPLAPVKSVESHSDIKAICGYRGDTVFFAHKRQDIISYLTSRDDSLREIKLLLPEIKKLYPVFFTTIKYPDVYILGGNSRMLLIGDLETNKFSTYNTNTSSFSNGTMIGPESYVVRQIDTLNYNASFMKISPKSRLAVNEHGLSRQLHDAGFHDDGTLKYDPATHLLLYVCYYNNNVIAFDTSLNLVYRNKTIDTNNTGGITVARRLNFITSSSPPQRVNGSICLNNGVLYVHAKLKADNEDNGAFRSNAVIDMYDERTGGYKGSFYVPVPHGETLKRFGKTSNGQFIAVFDTHINTFSLSGKAI